MMRLVLAALRKRATQAGMLSVSSTSAATISQLGQRRRMASKYSATRSGRRHVGWLQWLASFQVTNCFTHG